MNCATRKAPEVALSHNARTKRGELQYGSKAYLREGYFSGGQANNKETYQESGAGGETRTHTPLREPDFAYQLRLSPLRQMADLWSGLSLHLTPDALRGLGGCRQVSTPFPDRDLARDWHQPDWKRSPNLTPALTGFPRQGPHTKSGASTSSATPARRPSYAQTLAAPRVFDED